MMNLSSVLSGCFILTSVFRSRRTICLLSEWGYLRCRLRRAIRKYEFYQLEQPLLVKARLDIVAAMWAEREPLVEK